MSDNKTKPSTQSPLEYINNYPNQKVVEDCITLLSLYEKITKSKPKMWAHMIGYGTYHYKYESGKEGDYFAAGFAPSKTGITIYLNCSDPKNEELLAKLGKHKVSVSCLYIKKISDLDMEILNQIIVNSLENLKDKYTVL